MSHPVNRGPSRCPACGRQYGIDGARCYPGIPAVRTKNGQGIAARCERDGTLAVPPAMPSDVRGVVREFREGRRGRTPRAAWRVASPAPARHSGRPATTPQGGGAAVHIRGP
jgi:hypothetical protein